MGRKKKRSGRRRTPVRILPILAMAAAITDTVGYNNWGPAQAAVTGYRQVFAQFMKPSPVRGIVELAAAGIGSTMAAQLAPQAKLTVGKYVVRL